MEEEQLEELLEAALEEQLPLLAVARSEVEERRVAMVVMEAVSDFLLAVDDLLQCKSMRSLNTRVVRNAMSAVVQALGPGDPQVRDRHLALVSKLSSESCVQVILDYLPHMVEGEDNVETASQQVLTCLGGIIDRDPSLTLPILCCLSALPLTDTSRSECFQMALSVLSTVPEDDLPSLTRALLRNVTVEKEALQAWDGLRREMQLLSESSTSQADDPTALVAQVIFAGFGDSRNGSLLAETFIKTMEGRVGRDLSSTLQLLDLIILLVLSQHSLYEDATDRLFDVWLINHKFPFPVLDALLNRFCESPGDRNHKSPPLLYKRLVPSLHRLAIFLMLAPARTLVNPLTTQSSRAFVLHLHDSLDRERQAELVQSLLQLSQEATADGFQQTSHMRKRKRNQGRPTLSEVMQSVNGVLLEIAEKAPRSLVRFKHVLIELLTSTSGNANSTNNKRIQEICSVLAALVSSNRLQSDGGLDSSDLMMLLQKLLFSSSGGFGRATGDLTQVVNGLILATALISSSSLGQNDEDCVREWVLRIMLPSTRRMLHPELGEPCLGFLKALMNKEGSDDTENSSKSVFQHFKMILANTGLIQMLSLYQKTHGGKNDVLLGYENVPGEFSVENGKVRKMLFCVNYFLNRNELNDPFRWGCTTRWVFDLVDTYLKIGRKSSKTGWVPDGWLQASIEICPLQLSALEPTKKYNESLHWLLEELNAFDVRRLPLVQPSRLVEDVASAIFESATSDTVDQFIGPIVRFEVAILIGVSLSLAVVKNAYEKFRSQYPDEIVGDNTQQKQSLRLLQYQLIKLYDLRSKSALILKLLTALGVLIRRHYRGKKWACTIGGSGASFDDGQSAVSSKLEHLSEKVLRATVHIDALHSTLFYGVDRMDLGVLWTTLECPGDEKLLQFGLDALLCSNADKPRSELSPSIARLIQLKFDIGSHLSRTMTALRNQVSVPRSAILHVARSITLLVEALPRVRLLISEACCTDKMKDSYTSLLRLSIVYLHLLFVILLAVESSPHPETDGNSRDNRWSSLEWYRGLQELPLNGHRDFTNDDEVFAKCLFKLFCDLLSKTDSSVAAHYILELLSCLALREGEGLVDDVVNLSWTALHTVYSDSGEIFSSACSPYALAQAVDSQSSKGSSPFINTLRKVLESTIVKIGENLPSSMKFATLRLGLLRHWGLLVNYKKCITTCNAHLRSLVDDIGCLVARLNASLQYEKPVLRGNSSENGKSKGSFPMPSIPSLDASTLSEYFETVSVVVVGSIAVTDPAVDTTIATTKCGPYHHIKQLLQVYRKLVECYRDGFVLFPPRTTQCVVRLNREILKVTVAQLHRCVEWRNSQPLLSAAHRRTGAFDVGALSYLQDLLGFVASSAVGTALSLCDFSIDREGEGRLFPFKRTNLRYLAEKAEREIKSIALMHNLPPPSFHLTANDDSLEVFGSQGPGTKGFLPTGPSIRPNEDPDDGYLPGKDRDNNPPDDNSLPGNDNGALVDLSDVNSDDDDNDSFGAAGAWGESDDDNDSSRSLDLQTSLFSSNES